MPRLPPRGDATAHIPHKLQCFTRFRTYIRLSAFGLTGVCAAPRLPRSVRDLYSARRIRTGPLSGAEEPTSCVHPSLEHADAVLPGRRRRRSVLAVSAPCPSSVPVRYITTLHRYITGQPAPPPRQGPYIPPRCLSSVPVRYITTLYRAAGTIRDDSIAQTGCFLHA